MSAFSFRKKIYTGLALGIFGIFFLSIALYTICLWKVVKIPLQRTFYFLVSTTTHVEAGAHFAEWNGGAGYLLQTKGREYVVYSVYLSENDGEAVQTTLLQLGEETLVLPITIENLYIKSPKNKRQIVKIKGAFSSFYGCLQILNEGIARLSKGGTQEAGKEILDILQRELAFLRQTYQATFSKYAETCQKEEKNLKDLQEGVLLLKDLRYLLCSFCVDFLELSRLFSM